MANKFLMSRGLGKVLDSKVAKKVMIPVGNMTIKMMKAPFKMVGDTVEKEAMMAKKKDMMQRANAPVGAYGGTNTGAIKINTTSKMNKAGEIINPTKTDISNYNKKYQTIRKGRGTSDGRMVR